MQALSMKTVRVKSPNTLTTSKAPQTSRPSALLGDHRSLKPLQPTTAAKLTSFLKGDQSFTLARNQCASARPKCVKRLDVQAVIPSLQGDASSQPPPDLPSFLFKERIVYLGMSLVPAVTELILAELLYLQYEDANKKIIMYINSTGTTKEGQKLGYDTEAFAIYDTMSYIKPPIHTLCLGNAWGEAAMLLSSGEKGYRGALPSSTIMIKEPINMFRGQASDMEIQRMEVRNTKKLSLEILARNTEKEVEEIEKDISRPLYMSPDEAVKYNLIDRVLTSEK